jgi:MFS family permease
MSRFPLYLAQFTSGMIAVSLGPLLDPILRDLDIPLAQGGLPAVAFFIGTPVGILFVNLFLARVPVQWCLVGGAMLLGAGLAAAGLLAQGPASFCAAYFFVGFSCVLFSLIPGMWISAHVREKTAWVLNTVMLACVSAMIVTPFALGAILGWGATWRWILVGEAGCALVLAVILSAVPLADIPDRENLRLRHVKEVVAFNPRLVAAVAAAGFMYSGAEGTLTTWLPKFEVDTFGAGSSWAGLAVTFYFVGQLVGRVAMSTFIRRFLSSTLLMGFAVVMAVFIAATAVSPGQAASIALIFFAGLGASASVSQIGSYSSRFPNWHAGVVFSVFTIAAGLGSTFFPYVTGPVADGWGFRAAIAVAAIPALILAFLALCLRRFSGEAKIRGKG